MNRIFSLRRLAALLVKEMIQMRRDRITFAMMLGVPLISQVCNRWPATISAAVPEASRVPQAI